MSEPEQNDWPDRLIDQALREKLGGETPPDLSERILAAADAAATSPLSSMHRSTEMAGDEPVQRGFGWAAMATAATLAFLAGGALVAAVQPARDAETVVVATGDTDEPGEEGREIALGVEPRFIEVDTWNESLAKGPTKDDIDAKFARLKEESAELEDSAPKPAEEGVTLDGKATVGQNLFGSTASDAPAQQPAPTSQPGAGGAIYSTGTQSGGVMGERFYPYYSLTEGRQAGASRGRGGLGGASGAQHDAGYAPSDPAAIGLAGLLNESRGLSSSSQSSEGNGQAGPGNTFGVDAITVYDGVSPGVAPEPQVNEVAGDPPFFSSDITFGDLGRAMRLDITTARAAITNEKAKVAQLAEAWGRKSRELTVAGKELDASQPETRDFFAVRGELELRRRRVEQLQQIIEQVEGQGPGRGGDQYERIYENPFVETRGEQAVSTFSIDVDKASYANVRQFLSSGQLPPPDAVRLEELVNYFDYGYEGPSPIKLGADGKPIESEGDPPPFAAHVDLGPCPWKPEHKIVRIGVKGRELADDQRPLTNLVFLIDVSGSMNEPAKHPLVIEGLKSLAQQLGENDRVAIVVYASSEGLALPSTPGDDQETILAALDSLRAGGSTAGGAGIRLAYQIAEDNFIEGGVNRVILCTDGDFNVGATSTGELERLVAEKAKNTGVFLSVCGFGRGNLNDAMMETISNKGSGNYYYIDSSKEAEKVFVKGLSGTLVTIAKDVKVQVEFNPARVAGYRLLGYENRMLRTQDFSDDRKDAGEIGAGHTVTALYEIVPAGEEVPAPAVDELKYQVTPGLKDQATESAELLTLKMRYKQPDEDVSTKLEWSLAEREGDLPPEVRGPMQLATAVAGFGMLLRGSEHAGDANYDAIIEIAEGAIAQDDDADGSKAEFVELVRKARRLTGGDRPATSAQEADEADASGE